MSLYALEESAAKLLQTIQDEIEKKKVLEEVDFAAGLSAKLIADAKSFVGWLRKVPAWSAEFTTRVASERLDSRLPHGTRYLEAIVDDWSNEHTSLLALVRSNDGKWRKATLAPVADAVTSLLEFARKNAPEVSSTSAPIEDANRRGFTNRTRQLDSRSVERVPAFERFDCLPRFTDVAQELLFEESGRGLPLSIVEGFEGHPYFNKSDFTRLLTVVRRYCPDFSSQQWLENPDPSALLIEMELALERRKKGEASQQGDTANKPTSSPPPPPPAEARFSWKVHGENFEIRFDDETGSFRKSLVGFQRYRQLLQSRSGRVSMAELLGHTDERVANDLERSADVSVDREGLNVIAQEQKRLEDEREEARKSGDLDTVAECEDKLKQIDDWQNKQTRLVTEPDGKRRRVARNMNDPFASFRSTIFDSFAEARKRMADTMPKLAFHLTPEHPGIVGSERGDVTYSQSGAVPWVFE